MKCTLAASFAPLDWMVLAAYMAAVIALGIFVGRKKRGGDDFFLAGRSMPMWAVAISVLATSQSAATFVGGPAKAYRSDLTYLMGSLGGLIAVIIVAIFFIPAFYRRKVTSVYELLGQEISSTAQLAASGMFLIGRVFASGARLFILAIPFSMVAFENTSPPYLIASIAIIAVTASVYTAVGGIRAVIWTDVLQAVVYIGTVGFALVLLWQKIPADVTQIAEALKQSGDGNKLRLLDTTFGISNNPDSPAAPYSLWTILFGLTLLNVAAYGVDQDLAQRMLTCKSRRAGAWSAVVSQLLGWPVVLIFLLLGLLLYVFYQQPQLMGDAAPAYEVTNPGKVFLTYILNELPIGVRGLMMAGLFAAAMSSIDSALNAMASATIADFYRPLTAGRRSSNEQRIRLERRVARLAVIGWAGALCGFAVACVFWQQHSDIPLIDFALLVMVFAYSGLLAVFLAALFTNRGNSISVIAALLTGFTCVFLMQGFAWKHWTPQAWHDLTIAFGWQMFIATSISFAVCCLGERTTRSATVDSPS